MRQDEGRLTNLGRGEVGMVIGTGLANSRQDRGTLEFAWHPRGDGKISKILHMALAMEKGID